MIMKAKCFWTIIGVFSAIFLFSAISGLSASPTATPYAFRDLGTLPGNSSSQAWNLNDNRQVVGRSFDSGIDNSMAFSWTLANGLQPLGTIGGATSFANGVNKSGDVVGMSKTTGVPELAFYWPWGGPIKALPYLPSPNPYSRGYAINAAGAVAGFSNNDLSSMKACVWWDPTSPTPPQNLGNLTGVNTDVSIAYGINDSSLVVGVSVGAAGKDRPISWTSAGGMKDLGTLGGASGLARAVSNSGVAIGSADNAMGVREAFLIDLNVPVPILQGLGGLGGSGFFNTLNTISYAQGINDSRQVVGLAFNSSNQQVAFVWTQGNGMQDLNNLVANLPPGVVLARACAINRQGDIVGYTAADQAFLLTRKSGSVPYLLLD
jgi:probable HAF family extracellular repeat protein